MFYIVGDSDLLGGFDHRFLQKAHAEFTVLADTTHHKLCNLDGDVLSYGLSGDLQYQYCSFDHRDLFVLPLHLYLPLHFL